MNADDFYDKDKAPKKLFVGNWKTAARRENIKYIEELSSVYPKNLEIVVAVPYIFIDACKRAFPEHIQVAAQDLGRHEMGPQTGEIPAEYLADFKVKYVLIGHSERRKYHNDSDRVVNMKIKRALACNLRPILCLGDSYVVRQQKQHLPYVKAAFINALADIKSCQIDVAYEPDWSIGTGTAASLEQITEMVSSIKNWMKEANVEGRCIYGGSVDLNTIEDLMKVECLDGFLVGQASIDERFGKLVSLYDKHCEMISNGAEQ